MHIDSLFNQLRANVVSALQQMPKDAEGQVLVAPSEFGVVLIASAFQIASALGTARADMLRVVERCLGGALPEAAPRIIT